MNAPAGWYPTDRGLRYWDGTRWTEHFAAAAAAPPAPDVPGDGQGAASAPARTGVPNAAAWFGWAGLVVAAVLGGLGSGASGFFGAVGGYVLVVAVVALVRGHVDWARLPSRAAGAIALGGAVLLAGIGGATATPPGDTAAVSASSSTTEAPPTSGGSGATTVGSPTPAAATPTPTPSATTPSPTASPARGTALAALAELRVKGRAPKTGYSRDQFGQAWADVDRNGCDTRNDILRRDLVDFTLKAGTNGCLVLSGTLHGPYTGETLHFVRGVGTSSAVQIDHVVALSDAWQKGAQQLSRSTRTAFANDPLNLLAVDGPTNEAKGDGDAATWLPPRKTYRCAYVARQVAVKAKYDLWVTSAERDAIGRVLATCPAQRLPTAAAIPLGGGKVVTVTPTPTTSTSRPTTSTSGLDPRFDTCKAAKAAGYGPYVQGTDPEYDWYRDADHDGIVCE